VRVVAYLRVSTDRQDNGIEVQRAAICAEAERRGWEVEWIIDQGETGKNANRPGLTEALAKLDRGEADALIVSKLDRLSRSVVDFGNILRRATSRQEGEAVGTRRPRRGDRHDHANRSPRGTYLDRRG